MRIISPYRKRDGSELAELRINCLDSFWELECADVRQSPAHFELKNKRTEHGDHSNSCL